MSRKKNDEPMAQQDEVSFEKALGRLETIVEEMESGKLSLEDMMKRFEEGQGLVKVCSSKLNQVERRIEILVKDGESVKAEPFADSADEAGSGHDEPGKGLPF